MSDKLAFIPIAKGFSQIGVSLHSVFPDYNVAEILYAGYTWHVIEDEGLVVIHAVPPSSQSGEKGWEQWFASPGNDPAHHVLYSSEPGVPFHAVLETKEISPGLLPPGIPSGSWFIVKLDSLMGSAFADL